MTEQEIKDLERRINEGADLHMRKFPDVNRETAIALYAASVPKNVVWQLTKWRDGPSKFVVTGVHVVPQGGGDGKEA